MIKSLRRKFIAVAMCCVVAVLILIIGFINIFSYADVISKADSRLTMLTDNNGSFPKQEDEQHGSSKDESDMPDNGDGKKSHNDDGGSKSSMGEMSPETPFETRYFSVVVNSSGNVASIDTGKIAAISTSEASDYANYLYSTGSTGGFYEGYRYKAVKTDEGTLYVFLDCSREITSFVSFLIISILISVAGIAVVFVLVLVFSKIAVKPFAESYSKQKRFITDASHEIKTPLTIIEANTEVLEMTEGENDWTRSIRNQINRLSSLTQKLVFLAKMDENSDKLEMCPFSLSDTVNETAESFVPVAQKAGKTLDINVPDGIEMKGDEAMLGELVTVLIDNAVKYSSPNSRISVSLCEDSGKKKLTVKNSVTSIEKGNQDVLFERFYRADKSRSSETGGSGIGLSVAKAIVLAHKGKIHAKSSDGKSLEITAIF